MVGTDAAGKDHVAGIIEQLITKAGGKPERRKRWLNGKVVQGASSAGKHPVELLLEQLFLFLFPFLGWILPLVLTILLRRDIRRFDRSGKQVIVVGHNCLRGLAFYWGHRYQTPEQIRVSSSLAKALAALCDVRGVHVLVLDVDDDIRQQRIEKRERCGKADNFDRYMANNSRYSERIEDMLVWLAQTYLHAQLMRNNDLSTKEIQEQLTAGFLGRTP